MSEFYLTNPIVVREKKWGCEQWGRNSPLYCFKYLHIKKGWMVSLHYHEKKTETMVLLDGNCYLWRNVDPEEPWERMLNGEAVDIYPYQHHSFLAVEDCIILEVSTQHFETDSVRLVESRYFNPTCEYQFPDMLQDWIDICEEKNDEPSRKS